MNEETLLLFSRLGIDKSEIQNWGEENFENDSHKQCCGAANFQGRLTPAPGAAKVSLHAPALAPASY